jgi:hypothetical protein
LVEKIEKEYKIECKYACKKTMKNNREWRRTDAAHDQMKSNP